MTHIESLLEERKLPPLVFDRKQAIDLLSEYVYGKTPEFTGEVSGEVTKSEICYAGNGLREYVDLSFDVPGGRFTFPFVLSSPQLKFDRPPRLFVFLNFRPNCPDIYYPEELLLRNNFAVARICYTDVTADSEVLDGLAAYYSREESDSVGKIGLWAFAASRVLDYCISLNRNYKGYGVIGHSRLGKTALWAGAQDERFDFVCSNCSGCSGAAITRNKIGEDIEAITRVFPFWFCPKYAEFANNEDKLPVDQHLLLSLVAPRNLSVVSASNDSWADPTSEFLACCAASKAWEEKGLTGFVQPDRMALYEERFNEGHIGYYYREGNHYLSQLDWLAHMSFWNKRNSVW
ncbi:MAG: hypothetical protein II350_06315 [Clostridia bacterium]|nr:hypothetical protein [Clostridia bacterium]